MYIYIYIHVYTHTYILPIIKDNLQQSSYHVVLCSSYYHYNVLYLLSVLSLLSLSLLLSSLSYFWVWLSWRRPPPAPTRRPHALGHTASPMLLRISALHRPPARCFPSCDINTLQHSYCTHVMCKDVLQTGLGVGMGMNGTAHYPCDALACKGASVVFRIYPKP